MQQDVIRRVWTEFEPEVNAQGYELVEVEFAQEGRSRVLRLYIDKEGGILLEDCQAVSQLVSALLDAGDFVQEHYLLEVSSPGIDRPLRKAADFERFAGEPVKLTAVAPVAGRKKFSGVLRGIHDGLIVVECDGAPCEVHIENLKKAHLDRVSRIG